MADAILAAKDLRKNYDGTAALDGVSLELRRGELFGLLGPNGAGKTTLLSILAGLLDADGGEVLLDGRRFTRNDRSLRRRVGLGTQDLAVYPELTARENLLFFGRLYEIEYHRLEKRVNDLLAAVGLSDRADARAGTFSGGMKRRLNLAVAVVHEPEILFLDEPTTGVDPQSRNHIFELVKQLNAAGTTIVYTSHYMEEVQSLCPRLAILDAGQVKACSTLTELLKKMPSEIIVEGLDPNLTEPLTRLEGLLDIAGDGSATIVKAINIAPFMLAIAEICRAHNVMPKAIHVNEPTLERVFLKLTGRALRD
jgi:ABC-2 type transport system ATP-binding protein